MATNTYTADRRLYLDKDGKVVEANDPTRATLLVNTGGTIPLADAERYGLVTVTPAVVEAVQPQAEAAAAEDEGEKAQTAARPNKARVPSENK